MSQPLWTSSLPPPSRRILPRVHTVAAPERQTGCWPQGFRALGHGKVASGALPKADRSPAQPRCTALAFLFLGWPGSSRSVWGHGRETQLTHRGRAGSPPLLRVWTPLVHVPARERGSHKSWEHNTPPPTPRDVVSWSSPPQASRLPPGCLRRRLGKRARPVPVG